MVDGGKKNDMTKNERGMIIFWLIIESGELFSIFLTIAKDKQQPVFNFHSNMLLNVYLSGLTIFLSVILRYCSGAL